MSAILYVVEEIDDLLIALFIFVYSRLQQNVCVVTTDYIFNHKIDMNITECFPMKKRRFSNEKAKTPKRSPRTAGLYFPRCH